MFYTYILYSSKSEQYYVGWTTDVVRRAREHHQGDNQATKAGKPWRLLFYAAFPTKRQAKDFERYLKSGSGKAFFRKHLVEALV